jgi:hypothetical protein
MGLKMASEKLMDAGRWPSFPRVSMKFMMVVLVLLRYKDDEIIAQPPG